MAKFLSSSFPPILIQLLIISLLQSSHNPTADDLTALLDFKNHIADDPNMIMASWNASTHYCNWSGITCDFNKRVQIINLMSQKLVGTLPPSIGNLSFLEGINLQNNAFKGQIPHQIGLLSNLIHLNLTNNIFTGSIPSQISNCTKLTILFLEYNQLSGTIPTHFTSLSELTLFSVKANNLTGTFPDWIGNLSTRFSIFSIGDNDFHGGIPSTLGHLSGLTLFHVQGNRFSGELPPSIYNLSSMELFSVAENHFQGRIPQDIGLKFPNLQIYQVGINNFTGEIPHSLANASSLLLLDLSQNSLTGTIPSVLGSLPFLYWLNVELNLLGNKQEGDMNFLHSLTNCTHLQTLSLYSNSFGGELPSVVSNLSTSLEILTFGYNHLRGNLPLGIGNLQNLTALGFESNEFNGSIPNDIGMLRELRVLDLSNNQLTGLIPVSFGNLTSLNNLYLNSNQLQGSIPPQFGNCTRLLDLNISSNNLTGNIPIEVVSLSSLSVFLGLAGNLLSGPLPDEVGRLTNLKQLDVSRNELSGTIPSSLSSCLSMEMLIMGRNRFDGPIPEALGALRALEEIDFSYNNLTGKIPNFLGKLTLVRKLDLSHNDLEGEVLSDGIFSNATAVSVVGNGKLCGGASSFNLPSCSITARKSSKRRWIIPLAVSLSLSFALFCFLALCYILRKPKKEANVKTNTSSPSDPHLSVSYYDLHKATNGFSAENLIGSGSFGSVYRGILGENDSPVAVKVINLQQRGAVSSFLHECTVLRSTRHRNLLRIVMVCSGFDPQGREFKSLVTELMGNGSLDTWLHPSPSQGKTLGILERVSIAIDVASAVDYLHNYSHEPIIHCDLKPSNILLDEDMMARVADFGLAKVLLQPLQNYSVSVELRGSIGYIPPEYGTSMQISILGDVYSYGILLLELFTGKRPTDDMFNDGLSIHEYVAMALSGSVAEVLDPTLIVAGNAESECLASVLKIGVLCSVASPEKRMPMSSIVKQLDAIRVSFGRAK